MPHPFRFRTLALALVALPLIGLAQRGVKRITPGTGEAYAIDFAAGVPSAGIGEALSKELHWPDDNGLAPLGHGFNDKLGRTHERSVRTVNGIPVFGSMVITHARGGQVLSVNGTLMPLHAPRTAGNRLDAEAALARATAHVGAERYMWEDPGMGSFVKRERNDPQATFRPAPKLVQYPMAFPAMDGELRLAYQVDVYAMEPRSRQDVIVDAYTGEVLATYERMHSIDEPGTAHTAYSGERPIVTHREGPGDEYELRDMTRGGGIVTYDCHNTDQYDIATVPTSAVNDWTYPTLKQKAILDAHWGTEMTYDFYLNDHGWSSFDGEGSPMLSYVHFNLVAHGYSNNNNAFWDGERMTYGDGNGTTFNPLTVLDVTGHEITHGVTEHTAGLIYSDEPGALNESFSDIFGACIEHYAKPEAFSWLLGNEMSVNGSAFRSMSDPNAFGDPDTYYGENWWYSTLDHGGVHTNSGVQNFWFYLLCDGGAGVNDNNDAYAVQGIGMEAAGDIVFRALTAYLTPEAQYADARTWSIQAATDLYGACADETRAVTDAWHAVGVGDAYITSVTAAMGVSAHSGCSVPSTILFTNLSIDASSYLWDFGDGGTSTDASPSHTYQEAGTFPVTLIAYGPEGCGISDTIQLDAPIVVEDGMDMPLPACIPVAASPTAQGGIFRFSLGTLEHTSDGSLAGYEDNICSGDLGLIEGTSYHVEVELHTAGRAKVWLDLDNDGVFTDDEVLYAGPGAALLHQADVIVPAGIVFDAPLRLRVVSDVLTLLDCAFHDGQAEDYTAHIERNMLPPLAAFSAVPLSVPIGDPVQFHDLSLNVPTSWEWSFPGAEVPASTENGPQATYASEGDYDVQLIVANAHGNDTLLLPNYIHVVNALTMCSATVSELPSGVFYDPGGPDGPYVNSSNCAFLIVPPCAETITVSFDAFETYSLNDRLTVYDGADANGTLLGNFYGNPSPAEVTATSGSMYLTWITNSVNTGNGFTGRWTSVIATPDPMVSAFTTDVPNGGEVGFTSTSPDAVEWAWDFGDGGTATIAAPTHTYTTNGTRTVTLTALDAHHCASSTTTHVTITTAGIDEAVLPGIDVFPNPTDGVFVVRNHGTGTIAGVSLLDATGRMVVPERPAATGDLTVDISPLADGLYVLRLRTAYGERRIRITKH